METLLLIFGITVYLIISFCIGLWKSKSIGLADFIASKDSFGFWVIFLSLVGTIVGGGMFFAVGQIGYEAGVLGYILGFLYIIAFSLMGFLISKIRNFFKDKNYLTLIDLVDGEYKSKKTTFAFAVVSFFIYFFVLAGQFLVLGTFLRFFAGIQLTYAILIIAMIVVGLNIIIYSVVGGIRKDIVTDVLQMIVVFLGSLFFDFFIVQTGDLDKYNNLTNNIFYRTRVWCGISYCRCIIFYSFTPRKIRFLAKSISG